MKAEYLKIVDAAFNSLPNFYFSKFFIGIRDIYLPLPQGESMAPG
jgi:hypothetical protein